MPMGAAIFAGLAALYAVFLLWYGGRGKPLTQDEIEQSLRELGARSQQANQSVLLDEVRMLLANDDGREFAMHKWASIEKTQVFPLRSDFSLVGARAIVAMGLAAITLVMHWLPGRRLHKKETNT